MTDRSPSSQVKRKRTPRENLKQRQKGTLRSVPMSGRVGSPSVALAESASKSIDSGKGSYCLIFGYLFDQNYSHLWLWNYSRTKKLESLCVVKVGEIFCTSCSSFSGSLFLLKTATLLIFTYFIQLHNFQIRLMKYMAENTALYWKFNEVWKHSQCHNLPCSSYPLTLTEVLFIYYFFNSGLFSYLELNCEQYFLLHMNRLFENGSYVMFSNFFFYTISIH